MTALPDGLRSSAPTSPRIPPFLDPWVFSYPESHRSPDTQSRTRRTKNCLRCASAPRDTVDTRDEMQFFVCYPAYARIVSWGRICRNHLRVKRRDDTMIITIDLLYNNILADFSKFRRRGEFRWCEITPRVFPAKGSSIFSVLHPVRFQISSPFSHEI